jgi:hypothetical protein
VETFDVVLRLQGQRDWNASPAAEDGVPALSSRRTLVDIAQNGNFGEIFQKCVFLILLLPGAPADRVSVCRHASLSQDERLALSVKTLARYTLDIEQANSHFDLVDCPELADPYKSAEPHFFLGYVAQFLEGVFQGENLTRSVPQNERWQRLADSSFSESTLPLSRGQKAFVEENYVSRSIAACTFIERLREFGSFSCVGFPFFRCTVADFVPLLPPAVYTLVGFLFLLHVSLPAPRPFHPLLTALF